MSATGGLTSSGARVPRAAHATERLRRPRVWEELFDRGSLRVIPPAPAGRPAAVATATGTVDGRPVASYVQDSSLSGGSMGVLEAEAVLHVMRTARRDGAPLVGFLESAGARLQDGPAALDGFGRIFFENVALAREVPQISVVTGTSAGGGCYSPALTDFVVMTRSAEMFLTGPKIVRDAIGETVASHALGGAHVHQGNGVCHLVAEDVTDAVSLVRELLGYVLLPEAPARASSAPDPGRHLPDCARNVYDVRGVIRDLVDGGRLLELSPGWAKNLVTGLARIDGLAVGVVANQPQHQVGALDVLASEKGAHFVGTCDDHRVPLLVLVDTPGFLPGRREEAAGAIRHGAKLVRAFAAATVPRVTVVLRKAYGGAFITMNSKGLGADAVLAWTGSEIGIMSSRAAVTILHRRELQRARHPRALASRLADDYHESCVDARNARRLGLVDEIVEPAATRERVAALLRGAASARA